MNELVLIDETEEDRIYSYKTQNGNKYLVNIHTGTDRDSVKQWIIEYFDKHQWRVLMCRSISSKMQYLENLTKKMLDALPGQYDYVKV